MYIIGIEPLPDLLVHPAVDGTEKQEKEGNIFCKVTRIRDAILKLATDSKNPQPRPDREYPLGWVQRMISNEKRLTDITSTQTLFTISTSEYCQSNQCRTWKKLKYIPTNHNSNTNSTRHAMELLLNQ